MRVVRSEYLPEDAARLADLERVMSEYMRRRFPMTYEGQSAAHAWRARVLTPIIARLPVRLIVELDDGESWPDGIREGVCRK